MRSEHKVKQPKPGGDVVGNLAADGMSPRSGWGKRFSKLSRSPVGLTGAVIVAAVLFVALFGSYLTPHDPGLTDLYNRLVPPSWVDGGQPGHLLGTDQLGRDILSRIIMGTQVSVAVGISAVLVAGVVGVTFGLITGYFGGLLDTLLSRFLDSFMAIPGILLTMTVLGVLGPGVITLVFVLGFTSWVGYARVVRGEVLSLKSREYVEAARALGQSNFWILARHVLPNVMASIIVLATLNVATTIIAESSLSFLGLGVQPPTITWGQMLNDGRDYITTAWWLATFPGVAITISVLGVLFLGDWLRDVLDPRLRK